ncbi:hypothetical protein SARC_14497, partial [Sphaeroforma arctica JP610]
SPAKSGCFIYQLGDIMQSQCIALDMQSPMLICPHPMVYPTGVHQAAAAFLGSSVLLGDAESIYSTCAVHGCVCGARLAPGTHHESACAAAFEHHCPSPA